MSTKSNCHNKAYELNKKIMKIQKFCTKKIEPIGSILYIFNN